MGRSEWVVVVLVGLSLCGPTSAQAETAFFRVVAPTDAVITALNGDGTMVWTSAVAGVNGIVQRALVPGAKSNWTDYVRYSQTDTVSSLRVIDPKPPAGMAYIPAGSFSMGDSFTEGVFGELPVHTVSVSAFYMDKHEVTKAKWDEVYSWATSHGYTFDNPGLGKASSHPVHTISWYDCVKWCNARSEHENLTPCYTVGGSTYKTGGSAPDVNWSASGYRLPTEAEWEKAARGGASGRRFPWADSDEIKHARANYFSSTTYSYDTSPTRGYHPAYSNEPAPYTSSVGSFEANGYGLYDMAGNVWEWCWDWYSSGYYGSSPGPDPRGPTTGFSRVERGGCWDFNARRGRAADRGYDGPSNTYSDLGFRSVRAPGQ